MSYGKRRERERTGGGEAGGGFKVEVSLSQIKARSMLGLPGNEREIM